MNTPHSPKHDQLSERVFERIQDEHLVPRPRWEFLFKNYSLWALGALAVALGALAFSATLFETQSIDWRLSAATHSDFLSFFLAAVPILWIIALALFILIGYVNVHRTAHGYRYPFTLIALGAIVLSLSLGSGLYFMGFGSTFDDVVGEHVPVYHPTPRIQSSWWLAPEKGVLAGRVMSIQPSLNSFTLQDVNGHEWNVDGDDLKNRDITLVARGGDVRVVGVPTSATSTDFHACFVFPDTLQKHSFPSPLAVVASTSGRAERSNECKGIRPYSALHAIEDEY